MIRHRTCDVLMYDRIAQRLTDFSLDGALHEHVVVVMGAMPQTVLAELLDDPSFVMSDYDPFAGRVFHVPVGF